MKIGYVSSLILSVSVALLTGCDKNNAESAAPAATAGAASAAPAEAPPKTGLKLDSTKKWKPCEALTAEIAAKALGVEASQIESNGFGKICIHEGKQASESTEAYAQLGALNVFETDKKARFRFESSTRDTSAAEMKKANDEIREKAKKDLDKEANAEAKKKVADDIVDALAGAATYKPVEGVGDAAAMNVQDGQLHVLAGNVYFYVLAWSGPAIGDRSAPTTEAIKAARKKHLSTNWEKQQKLQVELASAIIDHLASK